MLVALAVTAATLAAGAATVDDAGAKTGGVRPRPGAGLVDGSPVAIVVDGPDGELAAYHGGGSGVAWRCVYYAITNGSKNSFAPNVDIAGGPVSPEDGRPYGLYCYDPAGQTVDSRLVTFHASDPFSGVAAAERAASEALRRLDLPDPVVGLNPPAGAEQLVGLPTWLWVSNPWTPSTANASLSGVTSTVAATPLRVDFDLGDGTTLTCAPGTPYDPTRSARAQHSSCTHTYTVASAARAGGVYPVTATLVYDVSWTATTGEGGPLGTVERAGTVTVRVVEAQALVR